MTFDIGAPKMFSQAVLVVADREHWQKYPISRCDEYARPDYLISCGSAYQRSA